MEALRPHEGVVSRRRVQRLAERIGREGTVTQPVVADRDSLVVLDGHHRLEALRLLGVARVPAYLVEYRHASIVVAAWDPDAPAVSKQDVIDAGLAGRLLAPKTTRHDAFNNLRPRPTGLRQLGS